MQNYHQQQKNQQQHQTQRPSEQTTAAGAAVIAHFTNTAKLPIETVKLLIASVSRRPNLWIRTGNGQKRSDINVLWQQVSEEVKLPADICRIKWGHLRDNFRKVFIRNTLSTEPPTTWRFYNDMRFMEAAVAENVMRHHRLREQSLYWQEVHSVEQRHASSASSSAVYHNYDRSLQNQFNFSELSAFFQNHGPITKRIKVESSESETSLNDSPQGTTIQNGNGYEKSNYLPENSEDNANIDDDDDDQFDEDAISTEDNSHVSANNTLSVDDNMKTSLQKINQTPKVINNETNFNEQDSDRLFLLSLLPYLHKVKEQRKLQVRQRLQDVLIQEFG